MNKSFLKIVLYSLAGLIPLAAAVILLPCVPEMDMPCLTRETRPYLQHIFGTVDLVSESTEDPDTAQITNELNAYRLAGDTLALSRAWASVTPEFGVRAATDKDAQYKLRSLISASYLEAFKISDSTALAKYIEQLLGRCHRDAVAKAHLHAFCLAGVFHASSTAPSDLKDLRTDVLQELKSVLSSAVDPVEPDISSALLNGLKRSVQMCVLPENADDSGCPTEILSTLQRESAELKLLLTPTNDAAATDIVERQALSDAYLAAAACSENELTNSLSLINSAASVNRENFFSLGEAISRFCSEQPDEMAMQSVVRSKLFELGPKLEEKARQQQMNNQANMGNAFRAIAESSAKTR